MNKKRLGTAFLLALAGLGACNKDVQFTGKSADKKNPRLVIDQEFPAALIGDTTVKFKPLYGTVDETLTLQEKPPVTATLKQVERAVTQDAFKQGHEGAAVEEDFDISAAGRLDMVIVIDDSSSMDTQQARLQAGLDNLLSSLTNVDWQLVVSTSDAREPCIRDVNDIVNNTRGGPGTILTKTAYDRDPNGVNAQFVRLITAGARSSGNEQVLFGARRALDQSAQPTCRPNNWTRSDSAVAVLVVTDEDNCHQSNELNFHHTSVNKTNPNDPEFVQDFNVTAHDGCKASEYNGSDLLATFTKMNRTPGQNARLYGIFWPRGTDILDLQRRFDPTTGQPTASQGANLGWAYQDLISRTHGSFGSLLDPFSQTLDTISKDVSRIVKRELTLKNIPIDQTVVVTVDGNPYSDYTIVGNTLKLNHIDNNQLKLKVTYRHDATPKFDAVKPSQRVASGTLEVSVNNAPLDPAKFSYDPVAGQITLVDEPVDDADIVVIYRKDGALPSSFDLTALAPDGAPLAVTVGGQAVVDATYDPATHALTFKQAPTDGANIAVTYKQPGGRITHYPQPALQHPESLVSMAVTDTATKAPLTVTMAGTDLVFNEADVTSGRQVTVAYDYGDRKTVLAHDLANTPLEGSVQVHVDDGSPDCLNNVTVVGTKVTFTCDADTLGEVGIAYKYVVQHYTTFTLSQNLPPNAYVQVYVDGQAITDYIQKGKVFTIPEAATNLDSQVRIIANAEP